MPVDMAMRFCISHSPPPLRGLFGPYEELQRATNRINKSATCSRKQQQLYKPLRPCLTSQQRAADDDGGGEAGVGWSEGRQTGKKKVVFADSKGMSLTAIHVFSKFDDEPYSSKHDSVEELQFDMTDLETATMDLKISSAHSLALDFKQPSCDYLDFRNRLIQNSVCLENCLLQERSLTGTIKVRNIGFEKSVRLRATFDSWASFKEIDCLFMNNVYGCQDTDTFSFVLELHPCVLPPHQVEFCICYNVQNQIFWDNNDGKNYVLKHVGWNGKGLSLLDQRRTSEQKGVKLLEMEFDQFGSPRTSSGLFPGWQSWGCIDNTLPYW